MTCGCQQCQWNSWCTCPSFELEWCGSIDQTDPNTTVFHIPCINVISSNSSIDVQKTVDWDAVYFDIKSIASPDRKVWACYWDNNPWYLFNQKLRVITSWPLTYNLFNCPWDSYVEIGFDESKLTLPTSAVCDCPEWVTDCTVSCANCNIQPKAMTELENNITIVQAVWLEMNYYVSSTVIAELNALWWTRIDSSWNNIRTYGWMTNSGGVITLCRDGTYEFTIEGSQEQNKAVHASRVGLLVITPWGSIKTLTQVRYSGTDAYFWSGSQPVSPDASHANYGDNRHTTAYAGSSTPSGWTFSMGTVFERLPVHWGRWRPWLEAWSKIVMFIKLSTYVTWDNTSTNVNWQFSIIWHSNVSAGWDDSLTFSVRNIDTPCECNA